MKETYEKIAVLENEIEACALEALLRELDIPHAIISYHDFAYDGLFQMQKGWGRIEGPAAQRREILEVLESLRRDVSETETDKQPPSANAQKEQA